MKITKNLILILICMIALLNWPVNAKVKAPAISSQSPTTTLAEKNHDLDRIHDPIPSPSPAATVNNSLLTTPTKGY